MELGSLRQRPRYHDGEEEGEADVVGVGAGDADTGPAQGEHQGCLAYAQSVRQLESRLDAPSEVTKEGTSPTKLLSLKEKALHRDGWAATQHRLSGAQWPGPQPEAQSTAGGHLRQSSEGRDTLRNDARKAV